MKTNKLFIAVILLAVPLAPNVFGQATDAPANQQSEAAPAQNLDHAPPPAPPPPSVAAEPVTNAAPIKRVTSETDKSLRLNFRGVPLDMVLNYLSDAAGFIIVMESEPKGKIDAWSNQPLTKNEAIELLNTVLNKNGYAAIRSGRTLKIVDRADAKKRDIPVRSGADPEVIPKNEEMVTQVIPVRHANASQLTRDLQPLLPDYATLTANDSGNALVLTDTQSNVRRMVEIVQALDTAISSVSTIKVFPLKYADAKDLANAVKELFQPTQSTGSGRAQEFFNRFGGGGPGVGGPGGFGGGGFGGGGGGDQGGFGRRGGGGGGTANNRVVAVADERANALVVSAPEDIMPTIENLVKEVDVSVADVTELRVFHLKNADPNEMSDLLAELFPDETRSGSSNNQNPFQGGFRFGGGFNNFGGGRFGGPGGFGGGGTGGFGNRGNQANAATSDRAKKMGRVVAVPDARTSSLVVTASSDMMDQIAQMVDQLDSSPARKQKVFVYSLENADVQQVEQIVRDMFQRSTTMNNRNNLNQNSALLNRSQQSQQQPMTGNQGFGNQGFGGGGGLGGGSTFGR